MWPADEPWPACAEPHLAREEQPLPPDLVVLANSPHPRARDELRRRLPGLKTTFTTDGVTWAEVETLGREHADTPMVAVAQLRTADIPDLRCPAGADLLQVVWCPKEHQEGKYRGPAVRLRWRRESDVREVLSTAPPPTTAGTDEYLPRPCVLHPEQVVEYPWWQELPTELGRKVREWDDGREFGEESYFSTSQAPGWKVGGYASWEVTDLIAIDCPSCRSRMDLLLVASPGEQEWDAWRPMEEAHLRQSRTGPAWTAANEPTGVRVGRNGSLRIFVCLTCPGTPHRLHAQ